MGILPISPCLGSQRTLGLPLRGRPILTKDMFSLSSRSECNVINLFSRLGLRPSRYYDRGLYDFRNVPSLGSPFNFQRKPSIGLQTSRMWNTYIKQVYPLRSLRGTGIQ